MKAVRRTSAGIEVVEVDRPEGDGERVHVRSVGICGSDLKAIDMGPLPFTLGHEIAGELDDGTPVAIEPLLPCGRCEACARSDYSLCPSVRVLGVDADGGMAEEIVVPRRCIVPIPVGVSTRDACLIEPLAVAVRGLSVVGLSSGQRVAVVGGGSIGLAAVAAARARGCEVSLVARHDAQNEAGERLGARIDGAGRFDLVVEASGTSSGMDRCIGLARVEGTILLLGVYWSGLEIDAMAWISKQIRVVPSLLYAHGHVGRDVDVAASLLATRPEIGQALISDRFPLDVAPEAFRRSRDRAGGAIKVVVEV
jgi:threonine dehydrogenase-like Zn-dependent dehydrogenase